VSLQKTLLHMYTLVVCPNLCVVASSSQRHSATAHVASHITEEKTKAGLGVSFLESVEL
jgi:GTPase involved in cell partitioning and DNA repair